MLGSTASIIFNYFQNKLEEEYNHLSLWYFIFFITGIVIYFSLNVEPDLSYIFCFTFGSIFALALCQKNLLARFVASLAISLMLGVCAGKFRVSNLNVPQVKDSIISQVEGNVESIKPSTKGMQVLLSNVKVLKNQQNLAKIRLNISMKYMNEISINDRVVLLAKLFKPRSNVLPGGYNFGFHTLFAGIGATGYAMEKPKILNASGSGIGTIVYNIRKYIYDRLIFEIGPYKGNFAAAILLGETKGIDRQLMNTMRTTGISHILCVSGLHLSLVAMIFFITARFLLNLSNFLSYNFNVKSIAAGCSIVGSYLYLELSGKQIAATRAFIMTSLIIIAIIMGRQAYPLRSIAIAACLILMMNPEYIFHPSFQLSFIAVLSLISGYQFYIKNSWMLGSSTGIVATVKLYIFSNIYSSFLASIITAPIVINHFYIFSTYSVLMNLIAVPIMSFFLMPLAILAVLLMPLGLESWIIKILGFFITVIVDSANFSVALPGSVWYFGRISGLSLVIFLIGFFWLSLWQTKWRIFGFPIILVSFIMMLNSKQPDLLFDADLKIVGLKNSQGKLVIHANSSVPAFNKQFWANWYGQENVEILPLTTYSFISESGKIININYNNECKEADAQINVAADCRARLLEIDIKALNKGAIIAVFCNKDKCYFERDKNRFNNE